MRVVVAASALILAGVVSSCSASVSVGTTPQVSTDELASTISSTLQERVGSAPDSVTCPNPLPAESGSTVQCTLTTGGATYNVDVTSNGVGSNDKVQFNFQVADQPNG